MSSPKKRRVSRRTASRAKAELTSDEPPEAAAPPPLPALLAPRESARSPRQEDGSGYGDASLSRGAAERSGEHRSLSARWKPLAIAGAAALATVIVVLAVWRPGTAPKGDAVARFVGSAACAACHAREHDAWKASHHARAMQAATDANVRGNFGGARFRYAGVESMFTRRDARFVVRTDGPRGKVEEFAVKYTFGVEPLQQYLIELAGGRLQALSIAWDTRPKGQGGERWFHLYPLDKINYRDDLHWTRRAQNWNVACADCHSVDVRKNYDAANDSYRTTWSDPGVGCEACHGPGSLHVDAANARRGDAAKMLTVALDERRGARWTIDAATGNGVRSRSRNADTEIEVCAPCHSLRTPIGEGWAAGKRFLDYYRPTLLEPGAYHPDGQQRDQVFEWGSFVQSRMYRQGVTCGDCHEPHGGGLRAQGDALCAQCHLAAKYGIAAHHHHRNEGAGTHCVDCHMPATPYMVIDPRRDHMFAVPRPDLSIVLGTPNACNGCHRQKSAQWADETVRVWYGRRAEGLQRYAAAFAYAERGAAEAGRNLAAVARDLSQPPFARASALRALARFPSAAATEIAKRAVIDVDPLVRDASVAVLAGASPSERWTALSPLLADPIRTIRVGAAAALADTPQAAGNAAFQRAAAEYEASLRSNADRAQARVALGTLYARTQRSADADAAFRSAIALDPTYAPAYIEFADAFRALDRDADAARVLRQGLERAPDDASLHQALGLALVRMKRVNDGLRELARAAQLAPSDAHVGYVYAVALNAHGRTKDALREIDRALARRPDDRDLNVAAITFRRDAGDKAGAARFARRFAERYSDDAQALRLAAENVAAR